MAVGHREICGKVSIRSNQTVLHAHSWTRPTRMIVDMAPNREQITQHVTDGSYPTVPDWTPLIPVDSFGEDLAALNLDDHHANIGHQYDEVHDMILLGTDEAQPAQNDVLRPQLLDETPPHLVSSGRGKSRLHGDRPGYHERILSAGRNRAYHPAVSGVAQEHKAVTGFVEKLLVASSRA